MMQLIVLANESLKEELLCNGTQPGTELVFIANVNEFLAYPKASAFIDLLFENNHINILKQVLPKLVIISSVEETLPETDISFVRINGWNTFLKSPLVEASSLDDSNRGKTEEIFSLFNKKIEWVGDVAGFITARVISMIINEAFIALNEGVSTRQEIDTAMKLGTNYPYGPFEWAEKIGVKKIESLLKKLSLQQERYEPFIS
ncbi:MAG: 3-hydroxyacyl-CoA dehydrogenase family protein [Flavisolibacter sp.]